MKLLTVVIPCYNAAAYMEKCLLSVVSGGDEMDVIVVDDGSTDETGAIADRWAEKYPDIVRVIHQPNGGHGEGLNQGIAHARGVYFKTVDSDDRLDPEALKELLTRLRDHVSPGTQVDLIVNDYVYDRQDEMACFQVKYGWVFSPEKINTWESCRAFPPWKQFMIHSMAYRTGLLRDMGLVLPKHTFYEDNLYIYQPLPHVKRILYLNKPLYGYYIGRADQSVNDNVIIKRLDQVTNIARTMITSYTWAQLQALPKHLRNYMLSNIAGQLYTTSALQYISGEEGIKMNRALREDIRTFDAALYRRLKRTLAGGVTMLPGALGRGLTVFSYRVGRRMIKF